MSRRMEMCFRKFCFCVCVRIGVMVLSTLNALFTGALSALAWITLNRFNGHELSLEPVELLGAQILADSSPVFCSLFLFAALAAVLEPRHRAFASAHAWASLCILLLSLVGGSVVLLALVAPYLFQTFEIGAAEEAQAVEIPLFSLSKMERGLVTAILVMSWFTQLYGCYMAFLRRSELREQWEHYEAQRLPMPSLPPVPILKRVRFLSFVATRELRDPDSKGESKWF